MAEARAEPWFWGLAKATQSGVPLCGVRDNRKAAVLVYDNAGVSCSSNVHCGICGSKGRLLYNGLTDNLFNAPGVWNLLQCKNAHCGVLWCDPMPLADQ